jgi:hypothetical protein
MKIGTVPPAQLDLFDPPSPLLGLRVVRSDSCPKCLSFTCAIGTGHLPVDIFGNDNGRPTANLKYIDRTSVEEEAKDIIARMQEAYRNYYPFSLWANQEYFVQVAQDYSRDEFDDLERQVAAERGSADDA